MLLAESIKLRSTRPITPPAPARVRPAVVGDNDVLDSGLARHGYLGDEAAAAAAPRAAAVVVAVTAPDAALAGARGVLTCVVQAVAGALDPGVATPEGALRWVRDGGGGGEDGQAVTVAGLPGGVVMVAVPDFPDGCVVSVVVTGRRVGG